MLDRVRESSLVEVGCTSDAGLADATAEMRGDWTDSSSFVCKLAAGDGARGTGDGDRSDGVDGAASKSTGA